MPVIAVVSWKGGVGKSTLAAALGVALGAELVDLDPRGSLFRWNALRTSAGLPVLRCTRHLGPRGKGWTIIDTPPLEATLTSLSFADRLLIPTQCGLWDLDGAVQTRAATGRGDLVFTLVPTTERRSLASALEAVEGVPVAGVCRFRAGYRRAIESGRAPQEYGDPKIEREIADIVEYLK